LVSPNKLHHLWLGEWARAYPGAQLWGPQSLVRKRRDLAFCQPLTDTPPPGWVPWIDQAWFRGSPLLDEVVFCHRPSRTAIVGDLIQTFTDGFLHEHWSWWQRVLARADGITEAKAHAPLEWRLSFIDRRAARAARDKVLGWGCERVIVAHGAWQPSNGSAFLGRALSWLRA